MASTSEAFLAENLDVLEELLAEDGSFEAEIECSIKNMPAQRQSFKCDHCPKICLSSRGLKRHVKAKHTDMPSTSQQQTAKTIKKVIDPAVFHQIVFASLDKVSKDECYSPAILEEMNIFKISSGTDPDPFQHCYREVSPVILTFNGDTEKFYPDFYDIVESSNVFPGLKKEFQLILGFELANHVAAYLSNGKVGIDEQVISSSELVFDDKQKAIIGYVSGYVVGKFYRKLRFTDKEEGGEYRVQCLSFLEACKLVEVNNINLKYQKLIDLKNRGGLWKVKTNVVLIFSIAESCFLSATKSFVTKIDAANIVSVLLKDASLLACFGSIRDSAEFLIKKEIALNLLEDMLLLYIRIRSHSFAKDKQQMHKIDKNTTKSRSLRTEIKKSTSALDTGH